MVHPAVRALLRTTPSLAPISNRGVLSITGSHAQEFLNGIVSSTVPTSPNQHFYSAFLHAQGRVLYDVFVYANPTADGRRGHLIEFDSRASDAPPLLPMLKRFVLRSKVKISDVSDQYDVWASWGSDPENTWETERQWAFARSGVIEPQWDTVSESPWGAEPFRLRDRRGVGLGHRMLVRKGDKPQESTSHDIISSEDYILHRILHGIPEGSTDITPTQAFPMDSNLDIMGALDFRKGCYVGQELTVRTYHTGVVRKRVFPVIIHHPDHGIADIKLADHHTFSTGCDIRPKVVIAQGDPKVRPRGTGKLLSTTQCVGLALLRLEQVDAVERGEIRLTFEQENADATKSIWGVTPWRPSWWPTSSAEYS
ncbi:hypothetical protein QCA50_014357 [Cerrena zonata]|uniref:CAF17 C-terminal domain-containing protein n=1 Tax=Cerrena zonata TaxID=2478898 RepID=A0AAW0FZ33_9APHY